MGYFYILFDGALKHATAHRVKYHSDAMSHIVIPTSKQIDLVVWEVKEKKKVRVIIVLFRIKKEK